MPNDSLTIIMSRRLSAAEALVRLNEIAADDSDDGSDIDDISNHQQIHEESSESSDDEDQEGTIIDESQILLSRAGIEWKNVTGQLDSGSAPAVNVFRARPGPTPNARNRVVSPLTAFTLFMDQPILRSIQKYTVMHGKTKDPSYDVSIDTLYSFIGLQIARGVLAAKNTPVSSLWNSNWGPPVFSKTMSRDKFKELMANIRFDNRGSRRE